MRYCMAKKDRIAWRPGVAPPGPVSIRFLDRMVSLTLRIEVGEEIVEGLGWRSDSVGCANAGSRCDCMTV
jgi:hypothetical protein